MSAIDTAQEIVTIQEYLRKHNLFENATITYPNPPDCVYKKDEKRGWIEVTSVYGNFKKFTQEKNQKKPFGVYEYECPANEHEYINHVINEVARSITIKDSKTTYKDCNNNFGSGILLIYVNDACFHWQNHIEEIINPDKYKHLMLNNFESVYIYNHRTIISKISSNPLTWTSEVLAGNDDFHLILKKTSISL